MIQNTLKIIGIFMPLVLCVPSLAQQQGRPAQPAAGQKAPAQKSEPAACSRYQAAADAAYTGYIRILKQDMPELGEQGADPTATIEKLQAMYEKLVDEAQNEDPIAYRKIAAIEIFSMTNQRRPIHEMTLKKVCGLAKLPGEAATILDMVACAVISVDETRRKVSANRDIARQMLAKAKGALPQNASPADGARILLDDATRGLDGCY